MSSYQAYNAVKSPSRSSGKASATMLSVPLMFWISRHWLDEDMLQRKSKGRGHDLYAQVLEQHYSQGTF